MIHLQAHFHSVYFHWGWVNVPGRALHFTLPKYFCLDSLCLSLIPMLLSHTLTSGSTKRQFPHIQVEENPEEIPFSVSVVWQQFRGSFCSPCQLSKFDVPFSFKWLVSRKWKGNFQVTQQLEVLMAPLASSCFSYSVWSPRAAFDTLQRILYSVDNKYH